MNEHHDETGMELMTGNAQLLAVLTRIACALEDQAQTLDAIMSAIHDQTDRIGDVCSVITEEAKEGRGTLEGVANRIEDLAGLVGVKF